MKGTARPVHWTYEDYLLFPEDGKRYEIVEGEKLVTPAPLPKHQTVLANLIRLLVQFLEGKDLGKWFPSPIDVVFAQESVVQPDLIFIRKDRLQIIGERAITGAPDLVVEVVSASSRKLDSITKRKLYAGYGVNEYWIVDPELERIEILVLEGGSLVKKVEHVEGDAWSLEVLPGFSTALREVFAD